MPTLLILLACGGLGLPKVLMDCGDLDCKRAWVSERWAADPAAVMAAVVGEEDPIVRLVLVQDLSEAHPGETAQLCERLPPDAAQRRCQHLNRRPHLWQLELDAPATGTTTSALDALAPRATIRSPWEGLTPLEASCPSAEGRNTCQVDLALTSARRGRAEEAARACLGVPEGKWRYECFFSAADTSFKAGQVQSVVELCMGSGPYLPRCLVHLLVQVEQLAPSAEVRDARGWEAVSALTSETRAALEARLPELSERTIERLWAGVMARSYTEVTRVTGLPLEAVEAAALPHVRAAAAARLWALESKRAERGAEVWVGWLKQALADREPSRTGGPVPKRSVEPGMGGWEVTLEGEEALPRVPYLGDAWRAWSPDEDTDLLICLLEAAARGAGKRDRLFQDAMAHADPLVRWTAARLVAADTLTAPVPGVLEAAAGDTDPRVRARAALRAEGDR
jgi:hypothetical protein